LGEAALEAGTFLALEFAEAEAAVSGGVFFTKNGRFENHGGIF